VFKDETIVSRRQPAEISAVNVPQNNIEQVLLTIIQFTKTRQKILIQNIRNIGRPDFTPLDLPAEEFSEILNLALDEHISSKQLLLCDSMNVRFGVNGSFHTEAVEDNTAKMLLRHNKGKYLKMQTAKLFENSVNQKLAMMLLSREPQKAIIGE
jgi:flagellar basal body rod protein FlgB